MTKQLLLTTLALFGISQVYGFKLCDLRPPGGLVRNPLSCSEFYMCRPDGRPVLFSCPERMNFDVGTAACAYATFCVGTDELVAGNDDLEYTPMVANPARLDSDSNVCRGAPTGVVLQDTAGCSTFYQCTMAGPVRFECPAGTLFDSNHMFCEVADQVACAFQQPQNNPSVGNLLNLLCFGRPLGKKYAHPTSCTHYFLCNGRNAAQVFSCPRGTAYSKTRQVCDFTHNVNC